MDHSERSPKDKKAASIQLTNDKVMEDSDLSMESSQSSNMDLDGPEWHSGRKRKFFNAMDDLALDQVSRKSMDPGDIQVSVKSAVESTKRPRLEADCRKPGSLHVPSGKSKLPMEIWHHIFSFLSPISLANLLHVNKQFRSYLEQSLGSIWSTSRKTVFPGMPRPLEAMSELDMWKLVRPSSCQFCGRNSPVASSRHPSPWESGPGPHGIRTIWIFGIRSCANCLVSRAQKDVEVVLSPIPSFLIPALPFALMTPSLHFIPSVVLRSNQPPVELQMTKYYYKPHIDELMRKFEEVKLLGSAALEEWIKGLEGEGRRKIADAARWEHWEVRGGLQAIRAEERKVNDCIQLEEPIPSIDSAANTNPANSPLSTERTDSGQDPTLSYIAVRGSGIPSLPFSSQTHRNHLSPGSSQVQSRTERSLHDVNEAKSLRRAEIERRCLHMSPPLTAAILSHIDSFSAAIQIPNTLTDRDWDILKPRLLAQRDVAERKEQERLRQSQLLKAKSEERRQQEAHSKEAKESLEREWDYCQKPVRDQMALYAEEFIAGVWKEGSTLTKEKCPQFAADVLLHVRNRFYSHIDEEDALARASGLPIQLDQPNAPPTRKLILENMKWLFDTKIKPLTEQHQKDLFLCNACENNPKFYGFEGVVQHYAAKHTNALSLGSVIVHWRAEWPEKPPFHPNPNAAKALLQTMPHHALGQGHAYNGQRGIYMATPEQRHRILSDPHQSPQPYGRSPFSAPYPYVHGPYQPPSPSMSPYYSNSHAAYVYPPPPPALVNHDQNSSQQSMYNSPYANQAYPINYPTHEVRTGHPYPPSGYGFSPSYSQMMYNSSRSGKFNSELQPYGNSHKDLSAYQHRLDDMARTAREIWNGTSGIKDMPNSIRAYVLIQHVVSATRHRYQYEPTTTLFADGLNSHPQMRPMRNLSGLVCRSCVVNGGDMDSYNPQSRSKKVYTFPNLISHFHSMHLERFQSSTLSSHHDEDGPKLHWMADMILLPDAPDVKSLVSTPGMDDIKLQLIADALPEIFPSPLPISHTALYTSARSATPHNVSRSDVETSKPQPDQTERLARPESSLSLTGRDEHADALSPADNTMVDYAAGVASSVHSAMTPVEGSVSHSHAYHRQYPATDRHYRHGLAERHSTSDLGSTHNEDSREVPPVLRRDRRYASRIPPTSSPFEGKYSLGSESSGSYSMNRSRVSEAPVYHSYQYSLTTPENHPMSLSKQRPMRDLRIVDHHMQSGRPSGNHDVLDDKVRVKPDLDDNVPVPDEVNAAERFLNSFVPGQDAELYQGSGSESESRREKTLKDERIRLRMSEERQQTRNISSDIRQQVVRGPAHYSPDRRWNRWNSPVPGRREIEIRRDARSTGIDHIRQSARRSPDVVHPRYGRKFSGALDSRRSHSRFDRYEAQRLGSFRARSKSPSMRDSVPRDSLVIEDPNQDPRSQTRHRAVYVDYHPQRYRRLEDSSLYSQPVRRTIYGYVEDLGSAEHYYDNSGEYAPFEHTHENAVSSGGYHLGRNVRLENSQDHYPEYLSGLSERDQLNSVYDVNATVSGSRSPENAISSHAQLM